MIYLFAALLMGAVWLQISRAKAENDGKWARRLPLPDRADITRRNAQATEIGPYMTGYMDTESVGGFTEYAADMKADFQPTDTYCCIGCFSLDYSVLKKRYKKIWTDYNPNVYGYAGFQRCNYGMRFNTILSLWNVYCEDARGNRTVVRPQVVYPSGKGRPFSGEGTGTQCLIDYPWVQGHWYRMLLQCTISKTTGNTEMQQWVCNLDTGKWFGLCKYDLGVPDVCFSGCVTAFLENFIPATAGEVRTMEMRNVRVRKKNGQWVPIRKGTFCMGIPHPGSYQYGTEGDTFWIISSGVPGLKGGYPVVKTLTVKGGESGAPYGT